MVISELTGEVSTGVISISSVLEMGPLSGWTNKEIALVDVSLALFQDPY